jgi:hypothetical protein
MLIDYSASTLAVIRKELHFILFASDPAYQRAIDRFPEFKDEFNGLGNHGLQMHLPLSEIKTDSSGWTINPRYS